MKRRIRSSSIAEVLIAVTVIAICFGVASLVVVRTLRTTAGYGEFAEQTEMQSESMFMLVQDTLVETDPEAREEPLRDSLVTLSWTGSDEKRLWEQEIITYE